ncbi:FAD-dependent oxidoreductase domain-containing protein 1 [Bactrocera dorsalis]|uniref:FAD-dependent oxidoreductase domain-containing protein 1 n=1 Tax=Bactrocera dorsalis TaxID=27457 RepID=A0A6I9V558_BACDO|nr:FAD-dependent oxidoreductase domain-containing protein 1 [Bactrocera dorsalis]
MIKTIAFTELFKINKFCRPALIRTFSDNNSDQPHPIKRTFKLLGNDMKKVKQFFTPLFEKKLEDVEANVEPSTRMDDNEFQTHCDILIIGGGGVGSAAAYWLKKKARQGLNVVVIEKDFSHLNTRNCLTLPTGGLHQQFLLPENIEMSLYGAEFMRNAKEELGVDVRFDPHGYLTLASAENAETLKTMSKIQNEFGARTEILTPERLKVKFPWLNIEDVAIGCQGLEKHGWFDSSSLLLGLRSKAMEYGAHFIQSELIDFKFQNQPDVVIEGGSTTSTYNALEKAIVKMPNGETRSIKFSICVLAAGTSSEKIAKLAKIGTSSGILKIPLPITQRNNYAYMFNSDDINTPGIGTPCVVDLSGVYFRRDGLTGNYVTGFSAFTNAENGPSENNFENNILPYLMRRMKMSKKPKVIDAWEYSYEYNVFDENGIIGPHAYYNNLYIASGFSGYGLQQSPAVGRAISELIIDAQFRTIDLSRLGFDRIIVDRPMFEHAFI